MEAARLWDLEAGSRGKQGLCCMHSGRRGQTRQILYTKKYQALQSITGYSGKAQQICIPPSLGGLPVRTIRENAFADTDCKTVILSPGIYEIEKWAFRNSHLEQLYLYDDLEKISELCISGL